MTTVISLGDDDEICKYVPLPVFTKARLMSQFSIRTYGRPKAICTPTSVNVAPNGDFIICDQTDKTIKVFNKMAQLKFDFGTNELQEPWNAVILPNNLIAVTDSGEYPLCIYTQRGQVVQKISNDILGTSKNCPMLVDQKGDILLADCQSNTIIVFDIDKNVIAERIKIDPTFPLKNCKYICSNKHDTEVIVSDEGDKSVKAYSRDNGYLHWRYAAPSGNHTELLPRGLCCDQHGHVIFIDGASDAVVLINDRGQFQRNLVTSQGANAGDALVKLSQALTIDNDGQLAISDGKSAEIKLFNYLQ